MGEKEKDEVTNNEETAATETTEEKEDSGSGDLIKLGASALHGLLGLLGAKIDFIKSLLENKDLHEHVGKTVEVGVNVTRDLIGAKVGAIRSTAELVPKVIDGTDSILQAS